MKDSKVKAVLFDLGNTLVSYYKPEEFWPVLSVIISGTEHYLAQHEIKCDLDEAHARALALNHEDPDHRVQPLLPRLQRMFGLSDSFVSAHAAELVECFLSPIFATARLDQEAIPVLAKLQQQGFVTGLISNTPWGSPAAHWRQELARHGLRQHLDIAVFCTDVGLRKPHPAIFLHALDKLSLQPTEVWFVGDDQRWDVWGAEQIGMQAVLLDPAGTAVVKDSVMKISRLRDLFNLLGMDI